MRALTFFIQDFLLAIVPIFYEAPMFLRLAVFGFVTLMLTCVSYTGTLLPFAFFHRITLRRLATVFSRSLQIKTFRRGQKIDQVFVGVYGQSKGKVVVTGHQEGFLRLRGFLRGIH